MANFHTELSFVGMKMKRIHETLNQSLNLLRNQTNEAFWRNFIFSVLFITSYFLLQIHSSWWCRRGRRASGVDEESYSGKIKKLNVNYSYERVWHSKPIYNWIESFSVELFSLSSYRTYMYKCLLKLITYILCHAREIANTFSWQCQSKLESIYPHCILLMTTKVDIHVLFMPSGYLYAIHQEVLHHSQTYRYILIDQYLRKLRILDCI